MNNKTKTGTIINRNIEYNEYPPPFCLVKVMERKWAEKLIRCGLIRFRKLVYYRNWENNLLGDPNDGKGLYYFNKHPMHTDSINDVYAWCLSLPEIKSERLLALADNGNYDCLVKINAPENLFERIKQILNQTDYKFWVHCGQINYDRGAEVNQQALNSQKFHHNIFQKAINFSSDLEYRISITNCSINSCDSEILNVSLGNCSDIIEIQSLPKLSV